jgi:hypothetical protein
MADLIGQTGCYPGPGPGHLIHLRDETGAGGHGGIPARQASSQITQKEVVPAAANISTHCYLYEYCKTRPNAIQ